MDKFLLESRFQQLHKARTDQPATSHEARKKELTVIRKSNRNNVIAMKRNIAEMSPFQEQPEKSSTKEKSAPLDRREKLILWQEEKKKRILEQKKLTKPIFKVQHVPAPIAPPDLKFINKEIKGKKFTRMNTTERTKQNYTFAPEDYKFKGPRKFIRQQAFDVTTTQTSSKSEKKKVLFEKEAVAKTSTGVKHKKTPAKTKNGRNNSKLAKELSTASPAIATRLRSKLNSTSAKTQIRQNNKKITKTPKSEGESKRMETVAIIVSKPSAEDSTLNKENESSDEKKSRKSRSAVVDESPTKMRRMTRKSVLVEVNTTFTPEKTDNVEEQAENSINEQPLTPRDELNTLEQTTPGNQQKELVYISPFVTISRGKSRARDEYHKRNSQGGLFDTSPEMRRATGTDAAAEYFHKLLDDEIERIQALCDKWNKYKEEENPPDEACDMINMAVGQSQLLINKKFKQFRGLINDCKAGVADPPIKCTDLHGYWDTANIQVDNLDKRFENLAKLRENNWEEILPRKKEEEKKVVKRGRKPKAQATSVLRELIKAKRLKAMGQVEAAPSLAEVADNATTPQKPPKVATPSRSGKSAGRTRNSMLASVLTSEASKRISSPGLIIMRVAHTARSVEKRADTLSDEPSRSILKQRHTKSTTKKSVLFKEDDEDNMSPHFIPNGCFSPQTEDNGRRRSTRLSRIKLF